MTPIIKRIQLFALALGLVPVSSCGSQVAPPAPPRHVFVIVMENKSPEEALAL